MLVDELPNKDKEFPYKLNKLLDWSPNKGFLASFSDKDPNRPPWGIEPNSDFDSFG